MDLSKKRAGVRSTVAAGSVWESRMKSIDESKNSTANNNNEGNNEKSDNSVNRESMSGESKPRTRRTTQTRQNGATSSAAALATPSGKRKTWKSESFDGNPIQIARQQRSESLKNSEESKSPIQVKKERSELSKSFDGNERSPIQLRRSEFNKDVEKVTEKSPIQLRKAKSESCKVPGDKDKNLIPAKESKPDFDNVSDDHLEKNDESEENSAEIEKDDVSEDNCKEFGVCEEKSVDISNVGVSETDQEVLVQSENDVFIDDEFEDGDDKELDDVNLDDDDDEEEEIEKQSFDIKEIQIPEQKPRKVVLNEEKEIKSVAEQRPKRVVNEGSRIHRQINTRPVSRPTIVKQQPPVTRRSTVYQNFTKPTPRPASAQCQSFPESHNKLQNLVDLVMWRDVSRSALVFGFGTFMILSSSYTQDINISFISVVSYLSLVYLAVIFLYRSIICRGVVEPDDRSYVIGEEEAVWLMKLFLPYLNEFLLKIKALFSGDPSTTMKLAGLLFILARCGNYITIWKMAKLGFFGVFIVPKVCTSYSSHLTAYGKFWIRRFRDAWDSCTHKKAVAIAIFTLVWNMSSVVARVWAVFMLFVALRYYQQSAVSGNWVEDDEVEVEELQPQFRHGATVEELTKEKKTS